MQVRLKTTSFFYSPSGQSACSTWRRFYSCMRRHPTAGPGPCVVLVPSTVVLVPSTGVLVPSTGVLRFRSVHVCIKGTEWWCTGFSRDALASLEGCPTISNGVLRFRGLSMDPLRFREVYWYCTGMQYSLLTRYARLFFHPYRSCVQQHDMVVTW